MTIQNVKFQERLEPYIGSGQACFGCLKPIEVFDDAWWLPEWYSPVHDECIDAFLERPDGKYSVTIREPEYQSQCGISPLQ